MAIKASKFVTRNFPTVNGDCAGDLVVNNYFYDALAADIVLNDIIDLGILPANHTVIDAILIPDDLDSNVAPTIALDVGIMSGTPGDTVTARTCGNEIFAASTAAQTGTPTRATAKTAFTILPKDADRSIGVKFQAASATAAAGRIRLQLTIAPADSKLQF